MKMFLVAQEGSPSLRVAGLFSNKKAAISRANFVDKYYGSQTGRWVVIEIGRENIKSQLTAPDLIYSTKMEGKDLDGKI